MNPVLSGSKARAMTSRAFSKTQCRTVSSSSFADQQSLVIRDLEEELDTKDILEMLGEDPWSQVSYVGWLRGSSTRV